MQVIIIDDAGQRETIRCRKIEPANMAINPDALANQPRIIIDDGDRIVKLYDIIAIIG